MLEGTSLDVPKIFGSAGSLPSRKLIHQSLIANRQSLSFWLGRSLALPIHSVPVPCPTPRFKSVATKTKPVKQANKKLRVLGCAFREKALTLNSQPATRNPSNSHPPRVGVQIRHHSLLAIHLTVTSLIYCCWRKRYLFWQNEQRGDGLWTSCGLWQWRST
jgi:hypothetical protein